MKTAIIVFPGSNCERDVAVAIARISGEVPKFIWHRETYLPSVDLIILPGGFSYGDYLRSGSLAASSPVMRSVLERAREGVCVLGICNGFQILTEAGLLPGTFLRNGSLRYICRTVPIRIETTDTPFTRGYDCDQIIHLPISHGDGNYIADQKTVRYLEDEGLIAFRYVSNPNSSIADIAGIVDRGRRILGLMPHPERAIEPLHGNTDGVRLFSSLVQSIGL